MKMKKNYVIPFSKYVSIAGTDDVLQILIDSVETVNDGGLSKQGYVEFDEESQNSSNVHSIWDDEEDY